MTEQPWFATLRNWADTFDEISPHTIEGIYVVGSAALDDWQPHSSDIDIIAITAEPADEEMAGNLLTAHAVFTEQHPVTTVDGPFLAWGDLTLGPQGVSRPWTLDGGFRHDAECFEINPVTWYTLATDGIALRGPAAAELSIPLVEEERVRFVIDNAATYWRSVHDQFAAALGELGAADTLPSAVPVWCLLGACRMLYTASTADVTSKSAAGLWVAEEFDGRWREVCTTVVQLRAREDEPVGLALLDQAVGAMGEILDSLQVLGHRFSPRSS